MDISIYLSLLSLTLCVLFAALFFKKEFLWYVVIALSLYLTVVCFNITQTTYLITSTEYKPVINNMYNFFFLGLNVIILTLAIIERFLYFKKN